MSIEQAKQASFAELARNIRTNVEAATQPSGRILDKSFLLEVVEILDQKIGGRRPELPPAPPKPHDPDYASVPAPKPTAAQLQAKKRLRQEIRAAQRAVTSKDEQRRTQAITLLQELRRQLADLMFKIRISGLPEYARKNWVSSRNSIREHEAKLAEYRAQMDRYEKDTAPLRREIERWDAVHGSLRDYASFRKIVDHLRADAEAYVRGEFVLRTTKVPWRFLPPGHRDVSWVIDEIARLRSKYPQLRVDEERLRYAQSLGPSHVFVGEAEFDGYFAFVFPNTQHVLLENPEEGNAAYIFKENWTSLSRRTKQELLSSYNYCVKRVLHRGDTGWKWRIRRRLGL